MFPPSDTSRAGGWGRDAPPHGTGLKLARCEFASRNIVQPAMNRAAPPSGGSLDAAAAILLVNDHPSALFALRTVLGD